jgi:hypothetical protein
MMAMMINVQAQQYCRVAHRGQVAYSMSFWPYASNKGILLLVLRDTLHQPRTLVLVGRLQHMAARPGATCNGRC